jgi:hypothetical protein
VVGYTADLSYPPEGATWPQRRVGDPLKFDYDTNKIVEISSNEVVLSASSGSGKRVKIKHQAAR